MNVRLFAYTLIGHLKRLTFNYRVSIFQMNEADGTTPSMLNELTKVKTEGIE